MFREKECFGRRKTLLKPRKEQAKTFCSLLKKSKVMLNEAILMQNYEWSLNGGVGGDFKAGNGYHTRWIVFSFYFGVCAALLIYDVHFWSAFVQVLVNKYSLFHMHRKWGSSACILVVKAQILLTANKIRS